MQRTVDSFIERISHRGQVPLASMWELEKLIVILLLLLYWYAIPKKKIGGSKRGLVEIRRCGYEATGGAVSSQWFGEVGAQVGKNQSIEASMLYDHTYRSTWIRMDDHT